MRGRPLPAALIVLVLVAAAALVFPAALRVWVTGGSVVVLAVAAAGAFVRARGLGPSGASAFDALESPATPAEAPADLRRFERALGWKAYSPEDFSHRVAPVLGRILTSKLAARGVDPRLQPELAARVAGPALRSLLDPGAVTETVDTSDLERMVDAIEAL